MLTVNKHTIFCFHYYQ